MRKRIYLREADEYVGPFAGRGDAARFLIMMAAFGESLEGVEIVEIDRATTPTLNAVSVEERKKLIDRAKRSPKPRRG